MADYGIGVTQAHGYGRLVEYHMHSTLSDGSSRGSAIEQWVALVV